MIALLPLLFGCRDPGKPGTRTEHDTGADPGGDDTTTQATDTGQTDGFTVPERDPTTVCEDMAAGFERVRLTSYHGRAWFWEPVPAHIDPDESGFMMGVQASTGPTDVCPDPMSWDWHDNPETPGEIFIKLVWKMPRSHPWLWERDFDWNWWKNGSLETVMAVQEGYSFDLGGYDAWYDRHTDLSMEWEGGFWDSHLCVTQFSPDRVKLQLFIEFDGTTADTYGPGALFLLDMHTDDGATRSDGEPCFEMRSAIPEDELWGSGG